MSWFKQAQEPQLESWSDRVYGDYVLAACQRRSMSWCPDSKEIFLLLVPLALLSAWLMSLRWLLRRRKMQQPLDLQSSSSSSPGATYRNRARTSSLDSLLPAIGQEEPGVKHSPDLKHLFDTPATIDYTPLPLLGPFATTLEYTTWTPPASAEHSMHVVLQSKPKHSIHRQLKLDLNHYKFQQYHLHKGQEAELARRKEEHNKEEHHHSHHRRHETTEKPLLYRTKAALNIAWDNVHNITALEPVEGGVLDLSLVQTEREKPKDGHSKHHPRLPQVEPTVRPDDEVARFSAGKVVLEKGVLVRQPEDEEEDEDNVDSQNDNTSPAREWTEEHTFASARDAAQFQTDVLACQVVGPLIHNMYLALELVHMGSEVYNGKESILLDDEPSTNVSFPGVAMDDVMRCLGNVPAIRILLERHYAHHYPNLVDARSKSGSKAKKEEGEGGATLITSAADDDNAADKYSLSPLYEHKRLLMGSVDFFRLFVPALSSTSKSIPSISPTAIHVEQHQQRIADMMVLRKRVASAAVLVRAYVRAMRVVNAGWQLGPPPASQQEEPDPYLTRRWAFDNNVDNLVHDAAAKNEYYEATVSRDVRCDVHSLRHLKKKGASCISPYQAYALVGVHSFQLPKDATSVHHPLRKDADPVVALPSLRRLVETNPDVQFFINAFFREGSGVAILLVFVRAMPKGVDVKFDTIHDRFFNSPSTPLRKRKLEVFIQLGPGAGLSPAAWLALKVLSAIMNWSRNGEAKIPFKLSGGTHDRTPFPGMTFQNYTETYHFGGGLQTNPALPKNYVAVNSHLDEQHHKNFAVRLLYRGLAEDGVLPGSILDYTYVLEGQREDELPERALASVRMVHVNAVDVALPVAYSSGRRLPGEERMRGTESAPVGESRPAPESSSSLSWYPFQNQQETNPENADGGTSHEVQEAGVAAAPESTEQRGDASPTPAAAAADDDDDIFKEGVDALLEILDGVTVPVRKEQLQAGQEAGGPTAAVATAHAAPADDGANARTRQQQLHAAEDVVNLPVLHHMTRRDLQRFYVASEGDLKTAAVRVVETAAWRGITFPIDTRVCRIELQDGQFFQQGFDREGNAVYYFRNLLLGPWRKDVDAIVFAVLHRLESSLQRLVKEAQRPNTVRCTLVVLMGEPILDEEAGGKEGDGEVGDGKSDKKEEKQETSEEKKEASSNPFNNPRVDPDEEYHVHTNFALVQRLNDILSRHYPERLARALVVPAKGGLLHLKLGGLRVLVPNIKIRSKVVILRSAQQLQEYVDPAVLVTLVGGRAPVTRDAFSYA